jgi:hypothetical protein
MFGHEFLEFEFRSDGKLRYANNSHYKNEKIIRKETHVSRAVLNEVISQKKIICTLLSYCQSSISNNEFKINLTRSKES